MQIIPAVDVLDGRVVRLTQGDYGRVSDYGADPVEVVGEWGRQGARLVHVVDLAGARDGRPDRGLLGRLASAGVPFQVGGGLRSVAAVEAAITAGAARAVVGTVAVWDAGRLAEMVAAVGATRVVGAVDVRAGRAEGAGWLDEGRRLADVLEEATGAGLERALVTAIARDGTMTGPDLGLIGEVQDAAPELAVIASGGVGALADLRSVADLGCEAAIVGRAFYEGRFTLGDAVAAVR